MNVFSWTCYTKNRSKVKQHEYIFRLSWLIVMFVFQQFNLISEILVIIIEPEVFLELVEIDVAAWTNTGWQPAPLLCAKPRQNRLLDLYLDSGRNVFMCLLFPETYSADWLLHCSVVLGRVWHIWNDIIIIPYLYYIWVLSVSESVCNQTWHTWHTSISRPNKVISSRKLQRL